MFKEYKNFNLPDIAATMLADWEKNDLFGQSVETRRGHQPFLFFEGPPSANGMPGIMHFSWTNYGQEDNSTVVYGDQGVMKIFGDYADDIVLEMRDGTTVKYHVGSISTNTQQLKSGVIDEFVASILENRAPIVTGIDGHNTLAVITKAIQSAKEERWLDIEYCRRLRS